MTVDTTYKSGKSEHDENFPVASRLIAPRFREPILAFYRFARAADDAADHPSLDQSTKLSLLAVLEDTLLGRSDDSEDALPLRAALWNRKLSPQHALDLLRAFRQDVTKSRYKTWEELLEYCRYSAMPVGRFVLDVHGEPRSAWAPSDALCTALQIINHLQDCAKDYRTIDRLYIPLDELRQHGANVSDLAEASASPGLLACIHTLAGRTVLMMPDATLLPRSVTDLRLCMETSVIVALAKKLLDYLATRDPLADPVHLGKLQASALAARAAASAVVSRLLRKPQAFDTIKDDAA